MALGQPFCFFLLMSSMSSRSCSPVSPLASRSNSGIPVGWLWMISGKSSGTRPASAIHSSGFSSRSSAIRVTRSAVGGSTFPCSTCDRYVGLTLDSFANFRRLNPFAIRLSRSACPKLVGFLVITVSANKSRESLRQIAAARKNVYHPLNTKHTQSDDGAQESVAGFGSRRKEIASTSNPAPHPATVGHTATWSSPKYLRELNAL